MTPLRQRMTAAMQLRGLAPATQAAAGAAGSDGGRAVEPWGTDGYGRDTISRQLTRCEPHIWPLACQAVAITCTTGISMLAGCPEWPGSRR